MHILLTSCTNIVGQIKNKTFKPLRSNTIEWQQRLPRPALVSRLSLRAATQFKFTPTILPSGGVMQMLSSNNPEPLMSGFQQKQAMINISAQTKAGLCVDPHSSQTTEQKPLRFLIVVDPTNIPQRTEGWSNLSGIVVS